MLRILFKSNGIKSKIYEQDRNWSIYGLQFTPNILMSPRSRFCVFTSELYRLCLKYLKRFRIVTMKIFIINFYREHRPFRNENYFVTFAILRINFIRLLSHLSYAQLFQLPNVNIAFVMNEITFWFHDLICLFSCSFISEHHQVGSRARAKQFIKQLKIKCNNSEHIFSKDFETNHKIYWCD